MLVATGTSGFSYKEWQGTFYPQKLPASRMLEFYAERLGTVELNNTFYRMPSEALIRGWNERTPPQFRFVLKAPRQMTHIRKLLDCTDAIARFTAAATLLGEKLGPFLFQLPPTFQRDIPRLEAFLSALPPGFRAAFEFRHPTWFDAATYAALRAHGVALCLADVDEHETPELVTTADFGYLRLRRENYTEAEIAVWAERIRVQPVREMYVFFKHELRAPALAQALTAHFVREPAHFVREHSREER